MPSRWRKRGELDTAQQRVNVSSSTEFPGRGGDSFQSGGSSSSSGRVWPSEKDRGAASSPIGRQQILVMKKTNACVLYCQPVILLIQFHYEWWP